MTKILLVEDEEKLARFVELELKHEGYQVDKAFDGRDGLEKAEGGNYELILLDIMLPGLNGLEVLRRLRKASPVPVIMLTARDAVMDKVTGLDMGADDYITKPFDPAEVVARVRSQLRRYTRLGAAPEPEKPGRYTVGPITLDEEAKTVTVDGEDAALTPIEFSILRLLIRHPGRIYSSREIYELVWNESAVGAENAVSVHIRHLRQKLEIDPSEPRYLKVVWGLGYKLEDRNHEER